MSIIKRIRKAIREQRAAFSEHAAHELDADDLTREDVRDVLLHGALVEALEGDPRGRRYKVRGAVDDEDVEVICRFLASGILWIVTVYRVTDVEDEV